jgi:hypothetical protein
MAGLGGPEKGRCKPGLKRAVLLHGLDIVKTACGRIPQFNAETHFLWFASITIAIYLKENLWMCYI